MPYLSDKDIEEELKRFWKDHAFYKSLVDGDYYELKDFVHTIRAKDREAMQRGKKKHIHIYKGWGIDFLTTGILVSYFCKCGKEKSIIVKKKKIYELFYPYSR